MVIAMPDKNAAEIRAHPGRRQALGQRLQEARKAAGFTLEKVGEALEVSYQSIWKWERGEAFPTADRLEKAATLYGVSLDWLMGQEKRIGETPAIYYPGEAPPTDEEMRLAMEFIRAMRRHRFKHGEDRDQPTSG